MPTIDLTDEEHAAVMAAIRRAVEADKFPRALRPVALGPGKASIRPRRQSDSRHRKRRRQPQAKSGEGKAVDGNVTSPDAN